jgi:predicted Zn-dependent protease with MMP-like domain
MVYDDDLPDEYNWLVTKGRWFELGHSMAEIDQMGLEDIGVIIGYFAGKALGEEKLAKMSKKRSSKSGGAS